MFTPLRVLGDAVKEKLAVLSASTCASSRRTAREDEAQALYGDPGHCEEEARGLLQTGYHSGEEEEDELFVPPKQKPRPGSGCTWGTSLAAAAARRLGSKSSPCGRDSEEEGNAGEEGEEEEASINALMKLRPSARDSLGDDETDGEEGSARPLIGTDRASLLSR